MFKGDTPLKSSPITPKKEKCGLGTYAPKNPVFSKSRV
ncbi:MAG TPA: hypothetical protein DHV15_03370 [Treponema sp.]|uniref:Uncharacterized protein n=1 Tax=Treponema denticola (strain ATCC 35405 / DSM 14222 / CIP 103919 / JCM 8153 / KCTC 15104) TaxID=243275 RepID=Q73Q26_TREDE|nr:hypothetical protein TDE_0618 [Treponema denticola ATCC 35405]HCY94539.1 hypothetical protein [Treponema sp.]